MFKCEVCGIRLKQGRWIELLYRLFYPMKNPKPMLIVDVENGETNIVFVCPEDREWIKKNPDSAEAIFRSKLF